MQWTVLELCNCVLYQTNYSMQSGEMAGGNVAGEELMLEYNTVDKTLDHVGKITLHRITILI